MKTLIQWGIVAIIAVAMISTGFQCSSAELTSAKLYIQRKDYQNALVQLRKEVEKNPKSEEGWFLMGQVQHELRDYRGMKEAFEYALKAAPTHKKEIAGTTLSVWGRLFNEGVDAINKASENPEQLDRAVEPFSMAIHVLPESVSTQRNLGLAYLRKGDMDKAAERFRIAFEQGKDLLAARLVGRIYLDSAVTLRTRFTETNREAFATKRNLESIRENMKAEDVRYALGSPGAINKPAKPKRGDTKEEWSYPQYNLALSMEDGVVKSIRYSTPYAAPIDSSAYAASVAQYSKAIEVYRKAQSMFPEDAEISEGLMNSYIGAERNTEARALLDERVKKYPDSKFDHYNLGVFLLKDMKYEGAVEHFAAALKIDTTFSAALYNLAASYVNWGVAEQDRMKAANEAARAANKPEDYSYKDKFRMALPYLEKVALTKGDDLLLWELLGQVYANLNEQAKAMEAYKKADEIRQGKK